MTSPSVEQIEAVLLLLSKWEVDEHGWNFQAGQIGGGLGYTKPQAARECAEMIAKHLPPAA